jgi:hypothetical protein
VTTIDQHFDDLENAKLIATHLQLPVDQINGPAFLSLLREEQNPSFCIKHEPGRRLVLHDSGYHNGEGITINLAQYAMYLAETRANLPEDKKWWYRKGQKGASLQLLWQLRLLYEIGHLKPNYLPFPPRPLDMTPTQKKVWEGIKLQFGLKYVMENWYGTSAMITMGFLAAWCDVSESSARKAKNFLKMKGVIRQAPGDGGKHPKYEDAWLFLPGEIDNRLTTNHENNPPQ